ncbi:hypothetical protein BG57_23590 [Caballeronia grimmiae]|uniref:Uncharacterized protein n=1 Tax=Caballeronia grimmiae TaxID=1071679 RepID=A0A069NFR0_9BURK|nr:hypothetical protein BG57_23590 [Caballeronia grimmiae]
MQAVNVAETGFDIGWISLALAVNWTAHPASKAYLLDTLLDVSTFAFRSISPIASSRNGCNYG